MNTYVKRKLVTMSSRDQELIQDQVSIPSDGSLVNPLPDVWLDGLKVRSYMDLEWIKGMKNMKLRPDDIWIVTYPKSGTTWTQQIVRFIISRGEEDRTASVIEAVPWVEGFCNNPAFGSSRVDVDKMDSPRAFMSHLPYDKMPCGLPRDTPGKYIYVVRNPKDVVVSFFHYERGMPYSPLYDWDEFFEKFVRGDLVYGNYFDHILSWWAHKDDANVLFLKYEDMQKYLPSAVSRIAKFIGQDINKKLVDEIARKTTFSNMKKDSSANYEWMNKYRRSCGTNFMRKGEVGDWKNHFTPEQAARLDAIYDERVKGTGLVLEFH